MANVTMNDINSFQYVSRKQKVDAMTLYLIGDNGVVYNMQEVEGIVFGRGTSQTVSMIHRCYNFSDRNGGRYRNGCWFEQQYGYRVTRADIEAFVKKYPNGTYQNGVTFDEFLLSRVQTAQSKPAKQSGSNRQSRAGNPVAAQEAGLGEEMNDAESVKVGFIVALVSGVVLFILINIGLAEKWWILSIVAMLFLVIGVGNIFVGLKGILKGDL